MSKFKFWYFLIFQSSAVFLFFFAVFAVVIVAEFVVVAVVVIVDCCCYICCFVALDTENCWFQVEDEFSVLEIEQMPALFVEFHQLFPTIGTFGVHQMITWRYRVTCHGQPFILSSCRKFRRSYNFNEWFILMSLQFISSVRFLCIYLFMANAVNNIQCVQILTN